MSQGQNLNTKLDILSFFEYFSDRYQKAEDTSGNPRAFFYRIGGFKVKLSFAGEALISYIVPALAHLMTEPFDDPDLSVLLWDSQSTKVAMPPPPWKIDDYGEHGLIRGFNNERFQTVFSRTEIGLSMLDRDRNLAIYWVKNPENIPYWETGAPLRLIFHFWLNQYQVQLSHAGAVGMPDGGVLLVGKGGSGKSTIALACLNSELFYASDDYCLVQSEPIPTVFSLYSTGKKNADDLDRLPFLKPIISNNTRLEREKALYFLHEHFPEKILPRFPLKAILIPRITGQTDTTLKSASSVAALIALAPSTIFQLPGARREAFERMGDLVRKVPSYYLNLGTNLKEIPEVIIDLLAKK